jgi:cytoskeletal protein RodZ
MNDFGGKLRQARERRGVSLRQIAASTKISVAALEALERNDISKLPGGIFSRAFVRSYAVEVGLNPDETVREFLERFHTEPAPSAAAAVPVPEEESSFESQQRMAGVLLKLILISVPLIALILYFTLRDRPDAAADTPSSTVDETTAEGTSSAPGAGAPPDATTPAPRPAPASQAAPAPKMPATPAGAMTLELHPTGPCWISLTVDGAQVTSRVMQPGEKEVHAVRDAAVLVVGDAGAFAFSVDGRPGRSLGEAGQTKTIRLTKDTVGSYLR